MEVDVASNQQVEEAVWISELCKSRSSLVAAAVISATLAQGPGWLPPASVNALLGCYGLSPAEGVLVASPHDAGEAARKLGGKVALKGMVSGLVRKSDAGAVRLQVLHTPGHTPESICLLGTDTDRSDQPWFLLSGDTLFPGDVGRPTGSPAAAPPEAT